MVYISLPTLQKKGRGKKPKQNKNLISFSEMTQTKNVISTGYKKPNTIYPTPI